ncbi:MAG: ribonuclease R [Deltaproteobacteria bacterium]|nr:ribonuclease R [Deltaproteobacteria bacterium]
MSIKENHILQIIHKRPLRIHEIAKKLGVRKDGKIKLRKILKTLHKKGTILKLKGGRFVSKAQFLFTPEKEKKNILSGFLRKRGKLYFLDSEQKTNGSYIIIKSKDDLMEDALAVGIKRDKGCEIIKVFQSLSDVKDIKEFVILKYGLPRKFTTKVENEIKKLEVQSPVSGRLDLRHIKHVTIDGENAKDFDDAVFAERKDWGYRLYVSIADVAHYVPISSALDNEAKKRGMSIYFPDSVIPMLPKVLSDDLCSLKPKKERLAFSVIMDLDKRGNLKSATFQKSVIRSVRRLTYEEVEKAIIEKDKRERKRLHGLIKDLEIMKELTEILLERRFERGSLDFDLPEPEILIDMEGDVKDILRSKRLFSHRIIEEFMIMANRTVAEFLEKKKVPALFRIHEEPEREKIKTFEEFLKSIRVSPDKEGKGIKKLQNILQAVRGKPYEFIVNKVLLRSMKQAKYSPQNKGHYGLGLECYLHFTSPIRRYPDLVCHRILEALIHRKKIPYTYDELESMALYLSERERLIMEVERELEDRIRILFMKENIGEEYEGIITNITSFGFFVELLDVFVEGLVLFSDLTDDYYMVHKDGTSFYGRRKKSAFKLGDLIKVKVISADVERKLLRFILRDGA